MIKFLKYPLLPFVFLCGTAFANQIQFALNPTQITISGGQVGVAADVIFQLSTDLITVTLTNQKQDPESAGSLLSELAFQFSGGSYGTPSLVSSSAQEITIDKHGVYTLGNVVSTGWNLSPLVSGVMLSALGSGQPRHTLIGASSDDAYDSNASISGSKPHNPFLYQTATFTLSIPGITAGSDISAATFYFGTDGTPVAGTRVGIPTPGPTPDVTGTVPEPGTIGLFLAGGGLLALAALRRRAVG